MANELNYDGYTAGLTITAKLLQGATLVGSLISLPESGTVARRYSGSVPGGTAAGVYQVQVLEGAVVRATGTLNWDGSAEKVSVVPSDIPTATANAAAVRTNLAAELARVDVATSTRSTYAGAAPDNTSISAIKAKTDLIPAVPAAVSDIPSPASIAAAVWAAVSRTLTSTAGATAAEIWSYVTRTLSSSASDPLASVVPGAYAPGTAGYTLGKLNVAAAEAPVVVIPAPPAFANVCRVYAYLGTPQATFAAGISISFTLVSALPTASGRLITGRAVQAWTDDQGRLTTPAGLFIELYRNDHITPSGSKYKIDCPQLNVANMLVTLNTDVADLSAILGLS